MNLVDCKIIEIHEEHILHILPYDGNYVRVDMTYDCWGEIKRKVFIIRKDGWKEIKEKGYFQQ